MALLLNEIEINSDAYKAMVALRYEVLRKPLGLAFTPEQLAKDAHDQLLLGTDANEAAIACCILEKINDNELKMRQVAVATAEQGKGVGSFMLRLVEMQAQLGGYGLLSCHARTTAVHFYEKNKWKKVGDPFIEIGIEHYRMEKAMKANFLLQTLGN